MKIGYKVAGLVFLLGWMGAGVCAQAELAAVQVGNAIDRYNVVWDSPSKDYSGSMPIGNGDVAANVWVEPNGDLIFYVAKSDAWSAAHELLKLGRIRVTMSPSLVVEDTRFRQELDLATGSIVVEASHGGLTRSIRFWIDANRPVVHVDIESSEPCTAQISLESWRAEGKWLVPGASRDVILPSDGETVRWYHRNEISMFAESMRIQHMEHMLDRIPDPLLHLTFGGLMAGEGLVAKGDMTLVTEKPMSRIHLNIHALTEQTDTPEAWLGKLEAQREINELPPRETAWQDHVRWWENFWDRSYIHVEGTEEAETVARAYQLQRWVQICASRGGEFAMKFNGSLFTVDMVAGFNTNPEGNYRGPDGRRWGGHYWWQNTRHPYWPMLLMGDYDGMQPLFRMYRNMLPLVRERCRSYFNHGGVFFPETLTFFGLNRDHDFNLGKENPDVHAASKWMRYYWQGGLELSAMMLEYYRHTQDAAFLRDTLLPIADDVVRFYDEHYSRGEDGKLYIAPAQVLETYHTAVNPMPEIAGLHTVVHGLLNVPSALTSREQRTRWQKLMSELPALPMAEENGTKWLKPADSYSERHNQENAELYGVFPYNLQGVGRPDLELVRETYRRRLFRTTGCWRYEAILAARLGFTEDAKGYLLTNILEKFHTIDPLEQAKVTPSRFPVFWHTGDWVPDQDHAGVVVNALQSMLMVTGLDGGIFLLPAWPDDWNSSFKLHAPYQTVVEGRVENGKVVDLKVTPESRRKDVVMVGNEKPVAVDN